MSDNTEQAEFWNGRMGAAWVDVEERIDQMLAPLSDVAVARAAATEGERVIDVGCGCGTTSLALTEGGASVWGVDIADKMIARAKEKSAGHQRIHFSVADAAVQAYTPDHQCVFSRFGIMFFADPVAAFTNIRTALTEDGRLVFLCWQPPVNNPWISVAAAALQPFQPEDAPRPDPTAPGPFAFGNPDYTTDILKQAGYRNIAIEPVEKDITLGATVADAMEFQKRVGPLSSLIDTLDEKRQSEAIGAVESALAAYESDRGVVMGAATLLVTARR